MSNEEENKQENVKTVEVRAVYKKGFIGPVKVEVHQLKPGEEEVTLDLQQGIDLAGRIVKEVEQTGKEKTEDSGEKTEEGPVQEGSHTPE